MLTTNVCEVLTKENCADEIAVDTGGGGWRVWDTGTSIATSLLLRLLLHLDVMIACSGIHRRKVARCANELTGR